MKLYGQSSATPSVCPGEETCEKWASAKGKTHTAKVRNVCHPCDQYPTKLDKGKGHAARQRLADEAMALRRERLSGYPRPPERITWLQFQALMIVDQIFEQQEIALRMQQVEKPSMF